MEKDAKTQLLINSMQFPFTIYIVSELQISTDHWIT